MKKRAGRSKGTPKKAESRKSSKRTAQDQPEKEEQKVKVEEATVKVEENAGAPIDTPVKTNEVQVEEEKAEDVEVEEVKGGVLRFPPQPENISSFDRDFSPDIYNPPLNGKWTPDDGLSSAVNDYFNTFSIIRNHPVQFNPLICQDGLRGEYRNLFVIGTTVDKQVEEYIERMDSEERNARALGLSVRALNESLRSSQSRAIAAIENTRKYSVEDAAQKESVDLTNIRYEELTMDMFVDDEGFGLSQELHSDNDMDTSTLSISSCGKNKYCPLTIENALAKRCLSDIGLLVRRTKKREAEQEKLHKRGQEIDRETTKVAGEIRTEQARASTRPSPADSFF